MTGFVEPWAWHNEAETKMAANFRTTISNAFLEWKYINLDKDLTEGCSQGPN